MGRLAKPPPKPGDRLLRKQEKGLVALPNGTPWAGGCLYPYRGRHTLPGLYRQAAPAWRERFGHPLPDLALQWHPDRNGMLTPSQVTPASNRKVWWQCPLGHASEASVSARTMNGSGCPYCAGKRVLPGFNDLATLDPDVAKQWHLTLNGSLTPEQVTAGSRRKIWWCCQQGHVWKAAVYSRTGAQHCGCPVCAGRVSAKRLARYQASLAERMGCEKI